MVNPGLAAWLLSLAWPLVKKVLVALGIGYATYEGLSVLMANVTGLIQDKWGQAPTTVLQILTIFGFSQALGIILGAMSARVTLIAVGKLTKLN